MGGMRRLAPFCLFPILLVLVLAQASHASTGGRAETLRASALENAVVRQINLIRVDRGLRPLTPSRHLTRAAATHSRAMLEGGFFAHTTPDGLSFAERVKRFYPVKGTWTVGENLAMFGRVAPSARAVVQAWLDSPDHKANLLEPSFRELGLGVGHSPNGTGEFAGMPVWVFTLDLGARG